MSSIVSGPNHGPCVDVKQLASKSHQPVHTSIHQVMALCWKHYWPSESAQQHCNKWYQTIIHQDTDTYNKHTIIYNIIQTHTKILYLDIHQVIALCWKHSWPSESAQQHCNKWYQTIIHQDTDTYNKHTIIYIIIQTHTKISYLDIFWSKEYTYKHIHTLYIHIHINTYTYIQSREVVFARKTYHI